MKLSPILLTMLTIFLSTPAQTIFTYPSNEGGYEVYGKTYSGKKIHLTWAPREPSIEEKNGLVALLIGCGSPCHQTFFFDLTTGESSKAFEAVGFNADFERSLVAFARDKSIIISKIFKPEYQIKIKIPMASYATAYYDVNATFQGDTLIVTYPIEKENGDIGEAKDTLLFSMDDFRFVDSRDEE